ncbi:outer membrane protein assembly factor BamE [Polaromonas sp.]|uniref:outer membrane protein assembly factor BamE n=1 Tax=Polaromonas sp. TaxID=1869339 RepID=UPI0017EECDD6|nr:outer membrane protein assembly factor BamE [Polaromonas sp.]NMM07606.1 outer membrane protein assembly factor BamE [Polaromonas sp.]
MPENHHHQYRVRFQSALVVTACMVLASCSNLNGGAVNPVNWITPYKVDVIQGNFIAKEQVEQLRAGMSRDQVKAVLGTPLMASLFHADRWDYIFTLKRQGIAPQSFKYTVFFKGDALERFEGDNMPSEAEFIAKLDSTRKLGKVPPLQATEEQLKAFDKSPKPATADAAAAASDTAAAASGSTPAAVQPTVYPPLESPKQ